MVTLAWSVLASAASVSHASPVPSGDRAGDRAIDPNFFCPAELIPNDLCTGPCTSGFVRAVEVDGVRHVVWTIESAFTSFYVASSTREGEWLVEVMPIPEATAPVQITSLAIEGDLLAMGRNTRVHLFRLVDQVWLHEATLASTLTFYGRSLALSRDADGTERLVVGAGSGSGSYGGTPGKVFLYRLDRDESGGSSWTEEQVIDAPRALLIPSRFGSAVAMGLSTLVVAAPQGPLLNPNGLSQLSAYTRNDTRWEYEGQIAVPAWFAPTSARRLALRGDTLAMTNGEIAQETTRVATFVHRAGVWTLAAMLQSEGAGVAFGHDLVFADSPSGLLLAAAVDRIYDPPVLTSAWLYRLNDGIPTESIRLRHPAPLAGNHSAKSVGLFGGPEPVAVIYGRTAAADALRVVRTINIDCDGDGIGDSCAFSDEPALDCDSSGVPDSCEIAEGLLVDRNGNGVPDICQPTPDLNGDGIVDGADLGILLANWGGSGVGDLSHNGIVNGVDLGLLLAAWSE